MNQQYTKREIHFKNITLPHILISEFNNTRENRVLNIIITYVGYNMEESELKWWKKV